MDTEFRKHSNQGFTMAELLVVVAIIAVLVAIAIPVFTSQLEKSREAVDLANARNAYAVLQLSKINDTRPDGSLKDPSGVSSEAASGQYLFTGNQFVKYVVGDQPSASSVVRMQSKNVDLTELFGDEVNIFLEKGWMTDLRDCVIVVGYSDKDGIDQVFLQPVEWYTLGP